MVSIIILAAGESKRFGAVKALAKMNSQTLIEHIIKTLRAAKIDEIQVVLGANFEKIQPILAKDIKASVNENYSEGQTSSLKVGLENLSCESEYFLVLPVDVPLIKAKTFDQIINTFMKSDCLIGIPTYQGKRAHPPIYRSQMKKEILKLKNDEPLYLVNRKFSNQSLEIPVNDPAILFNVNVPEDLERIKNYL